MLLLADLASRNTVVEFHRVSIGSLISCKMVWDRVIKSAYFMISDSFSQAKYILNCFIYFVSSDV